MTDQVQKDDYDCKAQVSQLVPYLSQEFEKLQQLHAATAERIVFLRSIICSGPPLPEAISMMNYQDTDAKIQSENTTQRDEWSPGACTAQPPPGIVSTYHAARSLSSPNSCDEEPLSPQQRAQQESAINAVMFSEGVTECSTPCASSHGVEESIYGDADDSEEVSKRLSKKSEHLRQSFARRSRDRIGGSSHSLLGSALTTNLKRLASKIAHPGSAQYSSENSLAGDMHCGCFFQNIRAVYKSVWFEPVMSTFIMLNAVVMIAEIQVDGYHLGHEINFRHGVHVPAHTRSDLTRVFNILEWIFGIVFALEVFLKLLALRTKFFKETTWNIFDLVVVACFVIERASINIVPVGTQWLRICRLVRLGRLLTLARTVQAFDHLFLITTAIRDSFSILGWALLLLFLIHMTIALVLSKLLQSTYFETGHKSQEAQHKLYEYFGTWTRAMLSTFEMSLANWTPICRLLSEEVSQWFALFILMHKLTIGFAVVGVINGVLMKETFRVAETDAIVMVRQKAKATELHRKNMLNLFHALDSSGDGKVSRREFQNLALFPSVKTWLASMELQTNDLDTMFKLIDENGDGAITFDELMHGIARLKGSARSIDLLTLHKDHRTVMTHVQNINENLPSEEVNAPNGNAE
jgi:Ca2+-binding EF-hand superfamily protein